MKLTIQTPTGSAVINNTHTKKGYKALWQYVKYAQKTGKPFIVLPNGTIATDLHALTSSDSINHG